jgi:hypothetical protein
MVMVVMVGMVDADAMMITPMTRSALRKNAKSHLAATLAIRLSTFFMVLIRKLLLLRAMLRRSSASKKAKESKLTRFLELFLKLKRMLVLLKPH